MDIAVLTQLLVAAVVLTVPVGLAAVGETICQRTGVLNLGVEGMMLAGTLASFLTTFYTGSPWAGVLGGVLAGIMFGVLKGLLSIYLKAEQVVAGLMVVLLSQGLTSYVFGVLFGTNSEPPRIEGMEVLPIPVLSSIPVIGPAFFNHALVVYLSIILIFAAWWVLGRTALGLHIRGVGELPAAINAAGVSVDGLRWIGVMASSAMAGLGGSVLIVAQLRLFTDNVTSGRGWIAVALVIFGRWKPQWVFLGAGLFGLTDAIQLRMQTVSGGIDSTIPYEILQALPYVLTFVILVAASAMSRRDAQPAALAVPFKKSEKS